VCFGSSSPPDFEADPDLDLADPALEPDLERDLDPDLDLDLF